MYYIIYVEQVSWLNIDTHVFLEKVSSLRMDKHIEKDSIWVYTVTTIM